jgi:hypothetical protein
MTFVIAHELGVVMQAVGSTQSALYILATSPHPSYSKGDY